MLLSLCFSGLVTHGTPPDSMMSVILVQVIKDKAGKVGSIDNYRPIVHTRILSKVLERLILDRLSEYITTTDNQFGFKPKHSTDQCIYASKELVESYTVEDRAVLCFIDASKAFDRVNHLKLFNKLRGVPSSLVRILAYWYANQSVLVKWGNILPTPFKISNRVQWGGCYLQPFSMSIWMTCPGSWGCAEQVVW